MAYKLIEIKGIGEVHAATLQSKLGISTVEELLELGASKKGREEIAAKTGIGEGHILRWVNMADLFRIKGVAEDFSDLLEMAGVDTVKELRTRNAANLHAKLGEANAQRQVSGRVPRMDEVESWIAIANELEPKVTH
jgi:ribosomal protein S13